MADQSHYPAPAAPTLVGRERERATLHDLLAAALAGRGSLVLIGGEAGIGKTALAEALLAEAAAQGALVLVGRCYDLSETPPYGPWVELFGTYAPGPTLPPLPAPFATRGTVGAVASRVALFTAVHDFFAALAAYAPDTPSWRWFPLPNTHRSPLIALRGQCTTASGGAAWANGPL